MSYHMVHGGLGVRPFLDLWLLRTRTAYNEKALRRMCADCGVLTFYEKSCKLVDAWMSEGHVPDGLATLESYVLAGGVFGNEEGALASKQREHRGLGYFVHRMFMSRELLTLEYPELKERPHLLPVYQAKRWARLLDPQKRSRVKREIDGVRAMNTDTVDSFDRLLLSLGL